jgi:molybdopterin-guanine dinucleotide biosynthesis protein A
MTESLRTGRVSGERAGIILAGGRASRVDGADKALFEIDGTTLLARAVDALSACDEIIIIGSDAGRPSFPGVRWVQEHPPFAGPVAALRCALAHTDAAELLVLPADLPGAAEAAALLLAADRGEAEGVVLEDPDGRAQWLTARYRSEPLAAAIAMTDAAAVRSVVSSLRVHRLRAPASATRDVDTWEDLQDARSAHPERSIMSSSTPLPPEALQDWVASVCADLGIDAAEIDIAAILDLARDVAHGVARPAAPVTAFIAGLAIARSGDAADVLTRLSAHAAGWNA